ncbi:2',5'-phosphodiesterase 12-like [Melanaphis sacchari]|uniref:2',5'-phosphodiesterase 12-like n=1 Tax=Melanaphis sacchari TaxID=742174 RepID=UPI000DC13FB9|nr:2',5'-phosphodiesterase 12-like [Melanaphis sacchari]
MKYFNNLFKLVYCTKRHMSSSKLLLWENSMFVNFLTPTSETKQKIMVTLLSPYNKLKRINLCRNSEDTIQVFIDRLFLKLSKTQRNVSDDKMLKRHFIEIKIKGIKVPCTSKCYQIFKDDYITLHIKDHTYEVIVDAPIINDLKLRTSLYQGLMIYPYTFDQKRDCIVFHYSWYRIDSKKEIEVSNEMAYIPTAEDVNCRLKLIVKPFNEDNLLFGPTTEVISSTVLENTIKIYPFEKRIKTKPYNSIRVVSYNILAGEYTKTKEAKNTMYPYCPEEILASSYRNPLVMKELQAYNGDIICLQEVDKVFFDRELYPILNSYNKMTGLFLKKNGHRNEGLCCFYSNKFRLLEQFNICLNDLTTIEIYCGPIIKEIMDDITWKQGLEKKTVFQVVALNLTNDSRQIVLVCNTHLISDPDGDFIRLFQALIELSIINKIKQNLMKDDPKRNVSVIFCGDFNSTPESGIYDLATDLLLPEEHSKLIFDYYCILEYFSGLKFILRKMYRSIVYSRALQTTAHGPDAALK